MTTSVGWPFDTTPRSFTTWWQSNLLQSTQQQCTLYNTVQVNVLVLESWHKGSNASIKEVTPLPSGVCQHIEKDEASGWSSMVSALSYCHCFHTVHCWHCWLANTKGIQRLKNHAIYPGRFSSMTHGGRKPMDHGEPANLGSNLGSVWKWLLKQRTRNVLHAVVQWLKCVASTKLHQFSQMPILMQLVTPTDLSGDQIQVTFPSTKSCTRY